MKRFLTAIAVSFVALAGCADGNGVGAGCVPPSASPSVTVSASEVSSPSVSPTVSPSTTPTVNASPSVSASVSTSPTPGTSPSGPVGVAWPQAFNTGYPHGLPGDTRTPVTLTPYTGPMIITTANTVIDSKDISGRLEIRARGVVIKNSRIKADNSQAVYLSDVYHVTIMDTELDGQKRDNSTGGISLIGDGSYTLIRVNAHDSGDIARANWGGVAIVDSWLHDPYCIQSSCHNDIIQSTGWTDSCSIGAEAISGRVPGTSDVDDGQYCLKFVHNSLANQNTQTSNILLKADQGPIHDVLVTKNLFNGGGYTVYWYDSGYRSTNGKITDNRFLRAPTGGFWPKGGYYGPWASNAAQAPQWTNNVWDDNGAQIPV